jgi:hypothetical protein
MPRPKSVPTALPSNRFSFLSGIHPDLDEELYRVDRQSSLHHSSVYKRTDFHPMQQLDENLVQSDPSTFYSSSTMPFRKPMKISETELSRSMMSHHDEMEFRQQEYQDCSRPPSSSTTAMSCEFSNRNSQCNGSMDNVQYSVEAMDKAKYKIKSQAEKIRELEAQLQRLSSQSTVSSEDSKVHRRGSNMFDYHKEQDDNDELPIPFRRVMSPEERLQAHKERKKKENKYREQTGKWDDPPALKNSSIVNRVKQKDDFVARLGLDPQERRKHEEMQRKMARNSKRLDDPDEMEQARDSSPLVRRQSEVDEIKESILKRKKKKIASAAPRRESLEHRLGMTLEQRREAERNRALEAAHRVHRSERPSVSSASTKAIVLNRCQTCGSSEDCEEDSDNPGIFYCAECWEEYEHECDLNQDYDFQQNIGNRDDVSIKSSQSEHLENSAKVPHVNRAVWIVHDNPKLGTRLVCSGPSKTACLIETKDPIDKNCTRLLHGFIDYSGPIVGTRGRGQKTVVGTDRGTECIRLGQVHGYKIDHSQMELRLARDKSVYEFQLNRDQGIPLTGPEAEYTVNEFLTGCDSSVDVILDPQVSPGGWYPIREACETYRKLAPQFRSKGVGYIRLGNDMGKNGLAFLSTDCCHTFLSSESVEYEDTNVELLKTISSFSNKPGYHSRVSSKSTKNDDQSFTSGTASSRTATKSVRKNGIKKGYEKTMSRNIMVESDDEDSSSISSGILEGEKSMSAIEVLKELQNMEVAQAKWKDKADLLIKLGKAVSQPQDRQHCETALNYIQDVISAKNVNVHVLRSALIVVEKIGYALGSELPSHIAWKTIMIEILKLLKNKQCGGGAREILQKLHGQCYTLSNSLIAISHVLGIGKTSNQRKLSSVTSKNAPSTPQPSMKANNVEVIEWLAVATETERKMEHIEPPMDDTQLSMLANFFYSHESHRDARCRKNALDGLLHTMLYGVDVLNMSLDQVESFCVELKTTKPRSWTRLIKSLKTILKREG